MALSFIHPTPRSNCRLVTTRSRYARPSPVFNVGVAVPAVLPDLLPSVLLVALMVCIVAVSIELASSLLVLGGVALFLYGLKEVCERQREMGNVPTGIEGAQSAHVSNPSTLEHSYA